MAITKLCAPTPDVSGRRCAENGLELAPVFEALQDALLNVAHRCEDALKIFLRREEFQVLFCRDFEVDTHTVGIKPSFVDQFPTASGDALQVNIPVETMRRAKVFDDTHHAFHRIVGAAHDAGAEKQPLDIVATVKLDG